MNSTIILRMNLLGGMDSYIRELGDEDYYEPWLMLGVPDGATDEDLREIAEDEDSFTEICEMFGRLVRAEFKERND